MENDVMAHLTTGATIVYVIEFLKQAGWFKWLHADSGTLNRTVSAFAAAAVAFGISASGDSTTGWTVHIPPATALLAGGYEWLKQFSMQQVLYDGIVQKAGSGRAES